MNSMNNWRKALAPIKTGIDLVAAATAIVIAAGPSATMALPLNSIALPPGFMIAVYADNVPNARQMALGPDGTLFVGSRQEGKVYALVDADDDQQAERRFILADGLNLPSGVSFRDGALYVAEVHRVIRFDDIESRLADPPAPVVVTDQLPSSRHHGWKFIDFGPDGKLYVPVGAPCNVCELEDPFGTILRMNPDGSAIEVFARGVRNSVGFAWHPDSGEFYFTDNGRDMLGDDVPPCELNRARAAGEHFGFPYCHGGDIADPEFGTARPCAEFTPPAQRLGPHVAPLGMAFYTGTMFPAEYRGQVFIAEHGSWNRSRKIGYRVMVVRLDDAGNAISYQPFAEGWLRGQANWGRPADVLVMPDGALLVADDDAGAIYRISYNG